MFVHPLTVLGLSAAALFAACAAEEELSPRKYVALMTAQAGYLKIDIGKALIANPKNAVPQAGPMKLKLPAGMGPLPYDFGWVSTDGAIVIYSKRHEVVVVQEPAVTDGKVKWSCVVHPPSARPELCGSDYENALLQPR